MFFESWQTIGRTFAVGIPAYLLLILLLRISGKRSLSKMNAFDLVVTVAIGSTLATVLTSKQTTLAQGMAALGVLIFGQFVITWLSVRTSWVQRLIKASPTLLYYEGQFIDRAMRKERVVRAEIEAAAREQGLVSMEQVVAVVLETDASLSIIARTPSSASQDLLDDVQDPASARTS